MAVISILVPIYNVEMYLEECLSSICTQTLKDIEIICIDDGSTDTSGKIADRFAANDQRVKVIHKENTGYGHSMNVGLDAATGEYIGIVESDDWILEDMMQTLYEAAEVYQAEFVKADFIRFAGMPDGKIWKCRVGLAPNINCYNRIFRPMDEVESFSYTMNIWSGIYRTDFIRKNKIRFNETPGASYQDNGFWFQTFALADRVLLLSKALYMHRRDNPMSSVNSTDKVYAACEEYDYIREWIKGLPGNRKSYEYLCAERRIANYFFTISRIADAYKEEFYEKFRKDYLMLLEAGEVAQTRFSPEWRKRIEKIVENPREACKQELEEYNRYLKILNPHKNIVIYGAGAYGRRVWSAMERLGVVNRVAYFAVTDMQRNPSEVCGAMVVRFADLPKDFLRETLVIVALKDEKLRSQVIEDIHAAECPNYVDGKLFFNKIM